MLKNKKILIFDTTLRDGEQSPGCSMNLHEKLKIFEALQSLKVILLKQDFQLLHLGILRPYLKLAKL